MRHEFENEENSLKMTLARILMVIPSTGEIEMIKDMTVVFVYIKSSLSTYWKEISV